MGFLKRILKGLQTAALLLFVGLCHSSERSPPTVVDLILPADNAALRALAAEIGRGAAFTINSYIRTPPARDQAGDILLVVSDQLLPLLQQHRYRAAFALYTNSTTFHAVARPNSSAVYSDQPLSRQLKLIEAILGGRASSIAIAWQHPRIGRQIAAARALFPQLNIVDEQLADGDNQRRINRLIQQHEVLLATPETALYNASSARSILLAAYRHQHMVIGPSQSFVSAGALASVTSQPEHYAAEIRTMIDHYLHSSKLPEPRYPQRYSVSVNSHVATALGLRIDEKILLKRLGSN